MAFEPSTQLKLLNVPFEKDYKNVLYYTSPSHQTSVMNSFVVKSYTGFTYIRKDAQMRRDYIMVPEHIDNLYNCNYVMYLNSNYTEKWFYGFITRMEYLNDNNTAIWFETDVYNTWCFDVTIKPSFVEREHTRDDTVGSNTLPESLETGEYKCMQWYQDKTLKKENDVIVMGITETASGTPFNIYGGSKYGGVFSGVTYGYWKDHTAVRSVIQKYAESTKSGIEAIQNVFVAPKWLCTGDLTGGGSDASLCATTENALSFDIVLPSVPSTINGYTPRNNKLFTYPYCYLIVTNQQGASNIIHNEKFTNRLSRQFKVFGVLTPGCSIRAVPKNYNGIEWNMNEGVNLGKYPICNWITDDYTNWLTQNSINLAVDYGRAGLNTISNIFKPRKERTAGSFNEKQDNWEQGTAVVNGLLDIADVIGEQYAHSMVPPSSHGNLNCGDAMYSMGENNFEFQDMGVKAEYARTIDEYFDMFGYKTNRVKQPNKDHRETWWYTKTIAVNVDGAIPMNDLAKFKAIYDNGVTFWRNASDIEKYTLPNNII